jgi:hypothetical protein
MSVIGLARLLLVFVGLSAAGCGEVVSLSALGEREAAVLDPGLPGRWRSVPGANESPDSHQEVVQVVEKDGGYETVVSGDGWTLKTRMELFDIDGARFADTTYTISGPGSEEGVESLLCGVQVHRLARYTREGDRYTLAGIDFEQMLKLIDTPAPDLAFLRLEDRGVVDRFSSPASGGPVEVHFQRILITEPSDRLRSWVSKHKDDPGLWSNTIAFERVLEPSPSP